MRTSQVLDRGRALLRFTAYSFCSSSAFMQFVTRQQQQRECIGLTAQLATSLIRWFPRALWAVLVRSIALKGTHERPKWKTEVEKCGGKRAKLVYCLLCRHPWIPWLHFVFVIVLLVHSLRASIAHGIQQGNKTRLPTSELGPVDSRLFLQQAFRGIDRQDSLTRRRQGRLPWKANYTGNSSLVRL